MNTLSRTTVTAAEFTRQFGQLRHALGDSPVHITHHGRETHVLLTAGRYNELRRRSLAPSSTGPVPALATFAGWLETGVLVLGPDATVALANEAACALLGHDLRATADASLWEVVPALAGSLAERHIRHALDAREAAIADLPAPTRPDRWWQIAAHPAARTTTILLRDITTKVQAERLADVPAALHAALAAHGGIGRLEITPRGHIAHADAGFGALVGLPEERLARVALTDLVPTREKPPLRATIERAMTGGGPEALTTALLDNHGRTVPVRLALCELGGAYGQTGATIVVTRA